MTYNFDADRWYDNERRAIEHQWKTGAMGRGAYEKSVAELDRRYDDMVERLDGTYQLPRDPGGDR